MSKRAGSGRRVVMSGSRRENQKGVCHVADFFLGIRPGYCDSRYLRPQHVIGRAALCCLNSNRMGTGPSPSLAGSRFDYTRT